MVLKVFLFSCLFLPTLCWFITASDEVETDALGSSTNVSSTDSNKLIAQILKVAITYVLTVAKQNVKTINIITDNSTIFNGNILQIVIGSLYLSKTYVYGLDTLNYTFDIDNDSNMFRVNLALDFEKIGINVTEYDMDIGILNQLPLYGDGNINVGLSKAKVDLDLNFTLKNYFPALRDIFINLRFRDAPISVTGIWRNQYADEIFAAVFNVLEDLFTMFWAYEADCISCVISVTAKTVIQKALGATKNESDYSKCSCGTESSSTYSLQEHIPIVAKALLSGNTEEILSIFKPEDVELSLKKGMRYMTILINEQLNSVNNVST